MTEKPETAWLVWIEGTGCKPEPQIWRDPFIGSGLKVLSKQKLPLGVADARLSIGEIVALTQIGARAA